MNERASLLPNRGCSQVPPNKLAKARRLLYISHAFNQFSEKAWQFCLILFLAAFTNYESLILVSSYGLISMLGVFWLGSTFGRYIDGVNRLFVARRFIGLENCAVLTATICCYILLGRAHDTAHEVTDVRNPRYEALPTEPLSIFLLLCIHVLGTAAKVLDTGFLVAVERDWIVVLSQCVNHQSQSESDQNIQSSWLSVTNVTMKQIDLSCQIVAPAVAGIFVSIFDDGQSNDYGSNLKGAAILVGILNSMALIVEYICTAKIYNLIPALSEKGIPEDESSTTEVETGSDDSECSKSSFIHWKDQWGLQTYFEQPTCWAGISLALLLQHIVGVLISGVCASRIGLWVFDISVTQLMQLHVEEHVRGLVGGVQQSLNAFFGMLSFVLGLVIPDPQYFHYYVSAGYASVGVAVICFWFGVFRTGERWSLSPIPNG